MSEKQQIVINTAEVTDALERLASLHGGKGERVLKKLMRRLVTKAKRDTQRDVRANLPNDPRQAYKGVRGGGYKRVVGGQINIYASRKVSSMVLWRPARRLRPGQRGGNRMTRSARTNQVDGYTGEARSFILRFLEGGTAPRYTQTRFVAYRAQIGPKGLFGASAERHMESAMDEFTGLGESIVEELWNKGTNE